MICPVCLRFGEQNDAVTQVEGTLLCGRHGMEAVGNISPTPGRSMPWSPPPVEPTPPTRPVPATPMVTVPTTSLNPVGITEPDATTT